MVYDLWSSSDVATGARPHGEMWARNPWSITVISYYLYPCRRLKNGGEIVGSLEYMIRAEKGAIIAERSVWQRFFSLKALHGILMFTSWINIVGRIFASNQSGDFTCHTYPVYKQVQRVHNTHLSRLQAGTTRP
jgi:hypothetical protein